MIAQRYRCFSLFILHYSLFTFFWAQLRHRSRDQRREPSKHGTVRETGSRREMPAGAPRPEENARGGSPPAPRTTFSNGYASCMVRFCVCCTMIQTNIRIYCSKHAYYCRITTRKNARYFFMLGYSADSYFNDARFPRFFAENHAKRLTVHAIFRIIKMKTGCRFLYRSAAGNIVICNAQEGELS